jgi:hypothetical protein
MLSELQHFMVDVDYRENSACRKHISDTNTTVNIISTYLKTQYYSNNNILWFIRLLS